MTYMRTLEHGQVALKMWGPLVASLYACSVYASPPIDRRALVARYNPTRNASSSTTPMQIGNGNFAFGADITGLQTLQPWAIMSTWGYSLLTEAISV